VQVRALLSALSVGLVRKTRRKLFRGLMLANILNVAGQVLVLFILIAVGFVCRKIKLLDDRAVSGMTNLVVYIVTPANIIVAFHREFRAELLKGLLLSFLAAFLTYGIASILAKLIIREKDEDKRMVLRFAAAYPNAGYMGIPLQTAILGEIGVFYCAAYIGMFHMYIWSYGVHLLDKEKGGVRLRKILLSPCIIAIFIGLILFFMPVDLPELVISPIRSLASLATPVPMIIIGYYLAGSSLKSIFGNGYIYVAAFVKMIFSPIVALVICRLLNFDTAMTVSCIIATSASSAAMTTMLATKFGRDAYVAAGMVSFTTIAAIVTMPVFIAIAQMF